MCTNSSVEKKFAAAVNVIQALPKDGPFQPSQHMMLTFYAYFKQAKFGPCNLKRPAFWDVVGKAKWDAWNSLGSMSNEQAMINYVDELKKIIEMMPQTGNVQDFIETLGDFYEQIIDSQTSNSIVKSAKILSKDSLKSCTNSQIQNEDNQSLEDVDSDSTCYHDTSEALIEENKLPAMKPSKSPIKTVNSTKIPICENVEEIKRIFEDSLKEMIDKQNALLQQSLQIQKLQLELNKSKKYDILSITFIMFSAFTAFSFLNKFVNFFRKKRIKN